MTRCCGAGLIPRKPRAFNPCARSIIVTEPKTGTGRAAIVIRSAAPFALVYLLLMAVMLSGSMMLQGVIEERSNKLLEAILACIRPGKLMKGKLFGLGAIGLLLVSVWVGIILFVGYTVHGPVADFLAPVLAGLTQPWMIAALLFYFLTGYLVVSLIFLGVGSISNSMQDAQGFLMPLIWALMIPIVLMVTSTIRDPGGLFPRIMSWIPVYTPFAMLARLGGGVAPWEVIGTGVLLLAFLAVEFCSFIGRLFEANLLAAGQPPKWSMLKKVDLAGEIEGSFTADSLKKSAFGDARCALDPGPRRNRLGAEKCRAGRSAPGRTKGEFSMDRRDFLSITSAGAAAAIAPFAITSTAQAQPPTAPRCRR